MGRVFWSAPVERAVMYRAHNALLGVAEYSYDLGYVRLEAPYGSTDKARNYITKTFLQMSLTPDDKLVMLDIDQIHQRDTVQRLAETPFEGVVGGLYRMRSENPPEEDLKAVMFRRISDREVRFVEDWTPGELVTGLCAVGTGAICIPRWALVKLADEGHAWPWFRYTYRDNENFMPGEDTYFCRLLEMAGVPMACNTSIVSPHLYVWPVLFPGDAPEDGAPED